MDSRTLSKGNSSKSLQTSPEDLQVRQCRLCQQSPAFSKKRYRLVCGVFRNGKQSNGEKHAPCVITEQLLARQQTAGRIDGRQEEDTERSKGRDNGKQLCTRNLLKMKWETANTSKHTHAHINADTDSHKQINRQHLHT